MAPNFEHPYRGPVKAVILDWAGTTCDYGCCAPATVFIEVFRRRNVDITIDEARGPMGAEKRRHIEQIAAMPRVAAAWRASQGTECSDADISAMYAEFIPLQIEAIGRHASLIPGTIEAVGELRGRGIKIGSTSGYSRAMMNALVPLAAKQGYSPDSVVAADEVPAGRPAPWMAMKSAMEMGVYPMEAIVKIGDTVPDIGEGLNAGMWTVAVVQTGNEVGLTEDALGALDPSERVLRVHRAAEKLASAGAHYVADGIGDVPGIIGEIEARIRRGDRP